MQHFVCAGDCAGENNKGGMCETEGCSKEGQPLVECNCEDGFHQGIAPVATDAPDVEVMDDADEL